MFLNTLPHDLKRQLSLIIYQEFISNFEFLKDKTNLFLSWFCPILLPRICGPEEIVYNENDPAESIYFLRSNVCHYILPKFGNT